MKLQNGKLEINRTPSKLDEEVIEFTELLEKAEVSYVIVSGYIPILTGRSRGTEDIDILIEKNSSNRLEEKLRQNGYWGVNQPLEEMEELLKDSIAVRIAKKGEVIPNFEVFYPEDRFDRAALRNSITTRLGESELKISPIELQIAYKLFLGSQKDMEDAEHLYQTFNNSLNQEKLEKYAEQLSTEEELNELRE